MKKINNLEASGIIGGTCNTNCVNSYMTLTIGAVTSCKLVTTCTDKRGNLRQTFRDTNAMNCGIS
ncbi:MULTISPECIES: DUF4762 family protein [Tenebrionibacter/Tenebrionicola group]|jgi:hypothetical protein|uniref:DUF4762 family protein n=1 Tax=Tenebrionibacter intestinalis TaxID=2799638 RepID=A0A8K0V6I3_9ENTR|nr:MULTISPECIES: DUF4762 family protein [Tenebrionibacter/Tenebrionicola group]MBK4715092.1 DUF4762 family protein [Tenebrionibacter intestinalis]MBV4414034.1 DUF4762 family protein [Tenebrionicola larvae]